VLFVELADELWVNQLNEDFVLEKGQPQLVVPDNGFVGIVAVSVLINICEESG